MPTRGTLGEGAPIPVAPADKASSQRMESRPANDGPRLDSVRRPVSLSLVYRDDRTTDQAFRDKLVAIIPQLRAFARGLCGSRDFADRIAKNAINRGWAQRSNCSPGTKFAIWMFRILRNEFHDALLRKGRPDWCDPAEAACKLVDAPSRHNAIPNADTLCALQRLPTELREVLILIVGHRMPEAEVASVVGCTIGTVKDRLARGRKALAFAVTPQDGPASPAFKAMYLNQILRDEQVVLMRYAAATDPADISMYRHKLEMYRNMLEAHPYHHRPYIGTVSAEISCRPDQGDEPPSYARK